MLLLYTALWRHWPFQRVTSENHVSKVQFHSEYMKKVMEGRARAGDKRGDRTQKSHAYNSIIMATGNCDFMWDLIDHKMFSISPWFYVTYTINPIIIDLPLTKFHWFSWTVALFSFVFEDHFEQFLNSQLRIYYLMWSKQKQFCDWEKKKTNFNFANRMHFKTRSNTW